MSGGLASTSAAVAVFGARRHPLTLVRHLRGRRLHRGRIENVNYGRSLSHTPRTGGSVKLHQLAEHYPHSERDFAAYYFNSTRIPVAIESLWLASRLRRRPIVVNQSGCIPPYMYGMSPNAETINARITAGLRLADFVVYQTDFCRTSTTELLGIRARHFIVLNNPVDLDRFDPRNRVANAGSVRLTLAGTQHMAHRVEFAIGVLAHLLHAGHPATLKITGDLGAMYDTDGPRFVEELVHRHGLDDSVTCVGAYDQDDAALLMANTDVLLHPQYNDACPTAVQEAMAAGVPVVASGSGGTAELVHDGAGALVDVPQSFTKIHMPDPAAGAEAVLRIMADRTSYAEAARATAERHFALDRWISVHQRLLTQLAGGIRPADIQLDAPNRRRGSERAMEQTDV